MMGQVFLSMPVMDRGEISWNAAQRPGGIYFCRLTADGRTFTRTMVLIK
jgi:hypothetical protein